MVFPFTPCGGVSSLHYSKPFYTSQVRATLVISGCWEGISRILWKIEPREKKRGLAFW